MASAGKKAALGSLVSRLCKAVTPGRLLGVMGLVALVWKACSSVYQASYVWQCTSLATALRPVARTSCPMPSLAAPTTAVAAKRFAVVMIYDEAFDSDKEATRLILSNRRLYCERHKYEMLIARNDELDGSRPAAWSKLLVVLKHLRRFDYVFYMDMDVVVTNPLFGLDALVGSYPTSDIIMTNDWSGPNTGMWLARNTPWTNKFLQLAWDEGATLVDKYDKSTGRKHPFEYEQRVFHQLLDSDVWRARGLPRYVAPPTAGAGFSTSVEIREHFSFAPQCAFNSYSLHPFDTRLMSGAASAEQSQWVPGDFVVHFAGKKGRAKTDLIKHYILLAEQPPVVSLRGANGTPSK